MEGKIFNIQRFSINDGPGIRTTVFMKGCPLKCIWCHNPESKKSVSEIFFDESKCISCGACAAACQDGCHTVGIDGRIYDRTKCRVCGACASVCPTGAIEAVGDTKSAEEVMREVMKDKIFYENSGGGITLSGGEPMMQFEFTYELLRLAKEAGLHTCIETCGFADTDKYRKLLSLVDIFLYDYKETDPKLHKEYTWVSNDLILENLKMLSDAGAKIVLRCPIIPSLNDRDEHLLAIAQLANTYSGITEINVEPYHPLGESKADRLGVDYKLKSLSFVNEDTTNEWISKIQSHTDVPVRKA